MFAICRLALDIVAVFARISQNVACIRELLLRKLIRCVVFFSEIMLRVSYPAENVVGVKSNAFYLLVVLLDTFKIKNDPISLHCHRLSYNVQ